MWRTVGPERWGRERGRGGREKERREKTGFSPWTDFFPFLFLLLLLAFLEAVTVCHSDSDIAMEERRRARRWDEWRKEQREKERRETRTLKIATSDVRTSCNCMYFFFFLLFFLFSLLHFPFFFHLFRPSLSPPTLVWPRMISSGRGTSAARRCSVS